MNNHPDTDSMLEYIHELIKRDCEHYMDETVRSDIQPMDFKRAIIDEKKIRGFKANSIFDWKKHFIFPTVRYEKSWFWLHILTTEQLMEQYYAEQRRIMLTDMDNHNKPDLDDVIWWNYPIFSYAVKVIKDEKLGELSYDSIPYVDVIVCKMILDIDPWKDALRHFKMNYTEDLTISKWNVSYVTKEMCPNMSDDEIKYMNHMWNAFFGDKLFGDKPHTPDFNNNKPKNSWLERKTKRGKLR